MLEEGSSQHGHSQVLRDFRKKGRTTFLIIQLLKLLILLLIPFRIQSRFYTMDHDLWIESLFWQYDSGYGFHFFFNQFFMITAYVMALPGFYYVHKLRNADPEKYKWKMGIGIIAVSQLLPSFIPIPYMVFPEAMYFPYYMFYYIVPFYVMIGYVIGPLINRKIQNMLYSYNKVTRSSTRKWHFKKIQLPLWLSLLVLMICPVIIISNDYSGGGYFTFISLFSYSSGSFDTWDNSYNLYIMLSYFPMFLLTGVFCIFNILFLKKIIEYYHGRHSQMDVLKYGILGALWPVIIWFSIESLFPPGYARSLAVPVPVLIIIGFLTLRQGSSVHHACRRVVDQIWEDEPTPSVIVPEETFEVVRVPFWYSIVSRFKKGKRTWVPPKKVESLIIQESSHEEIKVPWWYSIRSHFRKKEVKAWDPDKGIDDPWTSTKSEQ